MNEDIKARWVTALRSGEYRQGHGKLRQGDLFCCLGVLCDIAVKDSVIDPPMRASGTNDVFEYGVNTNILPDEVVTWAGLLDRNPSPTDDCNLSLSMMNDTGASFIEIADIIELRL